MTSNSPATATLEAAMETAYAKRQRLDEERYQAEKDHCAQEFTLGRVVYRAGYHEIEEGVIVKIERGYFNNYSHDWCAKPDGKEISYYAQFGNDWVRQLTRGRWYISLAHAARDLADRLKRDVVELRRNADKLEKLALVHQTTYDAWKAGS